MSECIVGRIRERDPRRSLDPLHQIMLDLLVQTHRGDVARNLDGVVISDSSQGSMKEVHTM